MGSRGALVCFIAQCIVFTLILHRALDHRAPENPVRAKAMGVEWRGSDSDGRGPTLMKSGQNYNHRLCAAMCGKINACVCVCTAFINQLLRWQKNLMCKRNLHSHIVKKEGSCFRRRVLCRFRVGRLYENAR